MARLVVRAGANVGEEHPLRPDVTHVAMGRESGAILVPDAGASRDHAEIIRRGDEIYLRDLGSRNGTLVNRTRAQGEVRLAFGDLIRIGNTVYELAADEADVEKALPVGDAASVRSAAPAAAAAPVPDAPEAHGDPREARAAPEREPPTPQETPAPDAGAQPAGRAPEAAGDAASVGTIFETLRALPARTQHLIGLAMLALLVGAMVVGIVLGRRGGGAPAGEQPDGRVESEQAGPSGAPAARTDGAGVGGGNPTTALAASDAPPEAAGGAGAPAPAPAGAEPGWFDVLTGRLASGVAPGPGGGAPGDGPRGNDPPGDLRGLAARLLSGADDRTPARFDEELGVDERIGGPTEEPEGDIDFEAEEREREKEREQAAAPGGEEAADADADAGRPAARRERVTTVAGVRVDADDLLALLPRTTRRRLVPKTRVPLTNADRAEVAETLEVLRTTKSSSMFSTDSRRRIAAVRSLSRHDDPAVSRALVVLAKDRDPGVRRALAEVLASHDNLESVRILLALLSQKDEVLDVNAAVALASLRDEGTVEWLYTTALGRGANGEGRAAVAEALGRIGEERAIPHLVKALRDGHGEVRAGAAVALGRLREAGAAEELVRLTRDRDPRARTAALLALGSIREPSTAPDVTACLKDAEPGVRSAAARALGALRVAETAGPLIEALGKEPSRVKDDIIRSLTLITALRHDDNVLAWRKWWEESGEGFVVAELALAASVLEEIEAGNVEYYGIRTHSTRICFVLDVSGSMQGQPLEDAKAELLKAIGRFTQKHFFNMVFFSGSEHPWQKRLTQATDAALARAKAHVYAQNAGGGTNIHDAMMLALKDPLVDTIFLLSDGAPSAGPITEPDGIRAAVLKANTRRVVVHCIGIGGHDREFMAGLAADNGGRYVVPGDRAK